MKQYQMTRTSRPMHRWTVQYINILLAFAGVSTISIATAQQSPGRLEGLTWAPSPGGAGAVCQRPGAGPGTLPNAIINGRGFKQPGDNESELTIAAFGDIVVAGFNDCAGAHMPSLRNGTVGWAFSTDGGQTWRDRGSQGALEKVQPSDFGVWSDPSLAVDAAGSFYFSNMYTEVGAGFYP